MSAKIVLIGAGMYAPVQFKALLQTQAQGKAELMAFAAKTEKTVKTRQKQYGVKGYTDWKKMLQDEKPDAVVVATPDHLHREMSVCAAAMGKDVLVEKPMDVTIKGAREMLAAAEQNNILMQVDMHKRFDPYHQKCKSLIEAGKLGDIQYGYAWVEEKLSMPRDFLVGWADKTTPAWLVGTHMVDLFVWMTKLKAVSTYATGQKGKLTSLGIEAYDSVQTVVEFENGAVLTVHSSWIHPDKFEGFINQGIRIVGSEGVMEIDSEDRGAKACLTDGGMATFNMNFLSEKNGPNGKVSYGGYGIESISNFVDNVNYLKSGGKLSDLDGLYPSAAEGLEVTTIMAAAHKSLAEKRVVQINELN